MFLTKTFMNKLLSRLDSILERLESVEERLASDRRAVPVLKDTIKDMRNDKKDLLNRIMSRDFEQLQIYTAHEVETERKTKVVLDETFAGEIVDLEKLGYETES